MILREITSHDSMFWRRLARFGAAHGPTWWVRYSPPVFGILAAAAVPKARRAVLANLRRVRGEATRARNAIDTARTFATFASCLAEVLSNGSKNASEPVAVVRGQGGLQRELTRGGGAIFVTAHTAGWELVGPLVGQQLGVELVMVMEPERDGGARRIHDRAREAACGIFIVHVGDDPVAALPLLRHLRERRVVALQIDRAPSHIRTRPVRMFDAPARVPEGPIRLAQISGAPIVPVFSARLGFRRYLVEVHEPIHVPRRASEAEIDAAAQRIADAMTSFVRAHPVDWFDFRP